MLRQLRVALLPFQFAIALQFWSIPFPDSVVSLAALGVAVAFLGLSWLHEKGADTPRREAEGRPLAPGAYAARVMLVIGVCAAMAPVVGLFASLGAPALTAFMAASAVGIAFAFLPPVFWPEPES
jgi:hypothetical protein